MFKINLGAQSDYSVLGVSPAADAAEIRARTSKIYGELERQRQKVRNEDEKRKIIDKQVSINTIGDKLSNPVERAKYDLQNVHLTFFSIRKACSPIWDERDLLLRWMHEAVREFIEKKGEEVPPMTDLERTDFTRDFTENELLERLLQQECKRQP